MSRVVFPLVLIQVRLSVEAAAKVKVKQHVGRRNGGKNQVKGKGGGRRANVSQTGLVRIVSLSSLTGYRINIFCGVVCMYFLSILLLIYPFVYLCIYVYLH